MKSRFLILVVGRGFCLIFVALILSVLSCFSKLISPQPSLWTCFAIFNSSNSASAALLFDEVTEYILFK